MNFKQFYLLKEDPDYAVFNLQDESIEIDYKDKHHTFITLDKSIFFTSINYHGSLLNNIWDYLYNNYSNRILRNNKVIELGEVRKPIAQNFLKTFENSRDTGLFRNNMLNSFPKELLGRAWVKNIKGADYLLVTIWNDQKYYTLKNLNLIKWMAEFLDINDSEKIIFETNDEQSKNLLEMISAVNDAHLKGRVGSADTSGNKPVHELPPEQKKQALIKMGAKPKVPMGIQDKFGMNVESFIN